ncbi:MAG: hypothetical protein PWP16_1003 [Eubacteriaceae bacterium]|nr:hypothetical protein [Eubacteriaceae bacterium]MDN5307640.1 hypothetical protein [Eubacteriaceae bacterium]
MFLNPDILYDNLSESFQNVQFYGLNSQKLKLKRPLLYKFGMEFEPDRLYVAKADDLSDHPNFTKSVVLVCIGTPEHKIYYSASITLICMDSKYDIGFVMNFLQCLFDRYEEWNNSLRQIVDKKKDLFELIDKVVEVFNNPMSLIDIDLKFIAYSKDYKDFAAQFPELHCQDDGQMKVSYEIFLECKDRIDHNRKKKRVFHSSCSKINKDAICINVYDNDRYVCGCYLVESNRKFRPSDEALLEYASSYITKCVNEYVYIQSSRTDWLKAYFIMNLNGENIDSGFLRNEEYLSIKEDYICVKCKLVDASKMLFGKYLCEHLETVIPNSVVFVHDDVLVIFIYSNFIDENSNFLINLEYQLKNLGYKAGISNSFCNIKNASTYFKQACTAIDIGSKFNPDMTLFKFEDYVLNYVALQACKEFPPDTLCAKGVLRLLEYDQENATSYFKELRTYLDCQMNAVKSSQELFIHRGTFIKHMEKINEIIKMDLSDVNDLLYVLLSYKIIECQGIN